jgi:RNA polymerase sigma-70 factor (ECF subfamily)
MPRKPHMTETTIIDSLSPVNEAVRPAMIDEDAFRAFYERTSKGLWVYLSRMTGNRQLVDDLLQETYYRFVRLGAAYEDERHRRNSLYCIATNLVRDAARRQRHRFTLPLPEPGDPHEPQADDRTGSRVEGRTDLARAMAHLDPREREMLWLAYAQGASHGEIAETLGMKTASIKTLLFRARRTLARLLRDARRPEA